LGARCYIIYFTFPFGLLHLTYTWSYSEREFFRDCDYFNDSFYFYYFFLLFYLYLYVLRERYYIHSYRKWEEETKRAAEEYVAREKAKKEASKKWWEDDDIQRPFLKAQEEINLARIEVIESGKFVPEAIELYNKAQMEMMERNYAKAASLAKEARTRMKEEKAN
jgi:hypothetical protein